MVSGGKVDEGLKRGRKGKKKRKREVEHTKRVWHFEWRTKQGLSLEALTTRVPFSIDPLLFFKKVFNFRGTRRDRSFPLLLYDINNEFVSC
jgi:hypothetical protein